MSNQEVLITQVKASFLAQPFQPELFECELSEIPFTEMLGSRGNIITFESQFGSDYPLDVHLAEEIDFLTNLKLGECSYGAGFCPVFPFICEYPNGGKPLTGANVLVALKPSNFRTKYIKNFDATTIPYPGYNPGVDNDEIHTDFAEQYIFGHGEDEDESTEAHSVIKQFVVDQKVWYTLLHTTREQYTKWQFSRYVILFAVGRSPYGNRLLGVVTHQVCHNLCD
jgi:hypothetical protein